MKMLISTFILLLFGGHVVIARPPSIQCNVAKSAICAIFQALNVVPAIRRAIYEEAVLYQCPNEQLLAVVFATLRTASNKSPLLFHELFPREEWPALENVTKLGTRPEDVLNFIVDESIQWLRFFFVGRADKESEIIKELRVSSKSSSPSIQSLIDYNSRKLEKSIRMKSIKFEESNNNLIELSENIILIPEDSKEDGSYYAGMQKHQEWHQNETPVVLVYKPVMIINENKVPQYRDVKRIDSSIIIDNLIVVKGESYVLAALIVRRKEGKEEYAVVTRSLTYTSASNPNPKWYILNSAAVNYVACTSSLDSIGDDYRYGLLFYVKLSSLPKEKGKGMTISSMLEVEDEWDQQFTEPIPRYVMNIINAKEDGKHLPGYLSDSDMNVARVNSHKREKRKKSRKRSQDSSLILSPRNFNNNSPRSPRFASNKESPNIKDKLRVDFKKSGRLESSGNLFTSYFRSSGASDSSGPFKLRQTSSDETSKESKDADKKKNKKPSMPSKKNIIASSLTKIDLSFLNKRGRNKSDDSSAEELSPVEVELNSPRSRESSPKSPLESFFKRESPRKPRIDSPKGNKKSPKSGGHSPFAPPSPMKSSDQHSPGGKQEKRRDSLRNSPSMPNFSVVDNNDDEK